MPPLHPDRPPHSLTPGELKRLTVLFIGVDGGYLGDFTRGELDSFFLHLGVEADVYELEGTTRERFIHVVLNAAPAEQARILRGVVDRFSVGEGPAARTAELMEEILRWAERCDGHMVDSVMPADASDTVARALIDAESLITNTGETSGVDRLHTALHGYLLKAAESAGISLASDDPTVAVIWKQLRAEHPRLQNSGARAQDIDTIQRGLASIFNALSPIRNQATLAHPNDRLLDVPEARLVINTVRTLLGYLEDRLR